MLLAVPMIDTRDASPFKSPNTVSVPTAAGKSCPSQIVRAMWIWTVPEMLYPGKRAFVEGVGTGGVTLGNGNVKRPLIGDSQYSPENVNMYCP